MKRLRWADWGFALTFVWLGFLCAISFMEAPLKFTAPSITRPIALEVGHIVFHALNKVELVLATALLAMQLLSRPPRRVVGPFAAIVIILLVQTFVLYPPLDARTLARASGQQIEESPLHVVFIVLEVTKFFLLLLLGYRQVKALEETSSESLGV